MAPHHPHQHQHWRLYHPPRLYTPQQVTSGLLHITQLYLHSTGAPNIVDSINFYSLIVFLLICALINFLFRFSYSHSLCATFITTLTHYTIFIFRKFLFLTLHFTIYTNSVSLYILLSCHKTRLWLWFLTRQNSCHPPPLIATGFAVIACLHYTLN